MGRRRRNQDTTQVANVGQPFDSQDNQLQEIPSPVESETPVEVKKIEIPVEEVPYEERPIPEAYFPPEEETVQEFMPEPNIQKTPIPAAKKKLTKSDFDALWFGEKPVESKTESKTEAKKTSVSAKDFDFSTLNFVQEKKSPKESEIQTNKVESKKVEIPAIKIDVNKYASKTDSTKVGAKEGLIFVNHRSAADSLISLNDTIPNDSLAKDSLAFIPVEKPTPKREIISVDGKALPETINNMWWYTPVLLVLFVAYVVIIRDRKKAIFSELQSFIKPNTDGSIFGFQWLQNSKYKFFLSVLGVISASLYLFLANHVSVTAIWIFFLAVTVFVVGKKVMLALLEYIYFEGADVTSMSGAFMVMVRQAGLLLIPSVLGLSFAPESYRSFFIYFGLFVIGVAIFAFNFKIIVNFLRGITSIFYLILYLCTLEVIPVAIFFVLGLLPRL